MAEESTLLDQAIARHQHGMLMDAEIYYQQAIAEDPENYEAYRNYAILLAHLRRTEAALSTIQQAILLQPENNIQAYVDLATIYDQVKINPDYLDKLIETYQIILDKDPDHLDSLVKLASNYNKDNFVDLAIPLYQRAAKLSPKSTAILIYLAMAYSQSGNNDKANQTLYQALELESENPHIYFCLVDIKAHKQDPKLIEAMEKIYHDKDALDQYRSSDQATLYFAMANVYASESNYDKAFEFYTLANDSMDKDKHYDLARDQNRFDCIKQACSQEFYKNKSQEISDLEAITSQPSPIFILGMPRSGTTLVEQILASHPEVYGAGELHILTRILATTLPIARPIMKDILPSIDAAGYQELGQEYLSRLKKYSENDRYVTDKQPFNFMHIALIKLMLPQAKIIHCNRDPIDTCWSNYRQFFRGDEQNYCFNLDSLAQYYKLYSDLMKHWRSILPSGSFYDIEYEALVKDPKAEIGKLLEYCELDWHDNCLEFHKTKRIVRTASSGQVNQPMYSSSINSWQNYKKHLDQLSDNLQ